MSDDGLALLEAQAYQSIVSCDENSVDLALKEIHNLDLEATVVQDFAAGVLLVNGAKDFFTGASEWADTPPIFVRHRSPVQSVLHLDDGDGWQSMLEPVVMGELLPYFDSALPFSVQSRIFPQVALKPFEVNQFVAQLAVEQFGLALDVREPKQILSIVARSEGGGAPVFYLGGSLTSHNLSDWAGGMRRFAREEGQVSRSEFKLLEAIEFFGLPLPAHGTALDLGASPGGWTRVLRGFGQYVTAVDPGDLDARLANDRGIRHRRMTAEAYLASDPDPFDMIVNDMRMDGRDSARLMVKYARLLYPHGWALMTLKLPEQRREPILEHSFAILREAYTIAGARQLFHNRSEITLWLQPKVDSLRD